MTLFCAAIDWRPALFRAFGIGRYVRNLVEGMLEADPKLRLELLAVFLRGRTRRLREFPKPDDPRAQVYGMSLPARAWPFLARFGLGADVMLRDAQLLHDTDYFATPCRRLPRVATLYDTAWLPHLGHVDLAQSKKMADAVVRLLDGAPEIVTISQSARIELCEALRLRPERVHVTPLAPDPIFRRPATSEVRAAARALHRFDAPYVIHLGTLEPRKNLKTLIRAHAAAAVKVPHLGLILLGRRGWRHEEVIAEIAASPARDDIRWLGDVSDPVCAALVRDAAALAFPTLHEGFGLPAVEGLAAGVPVVLSDLAVLREVAGTEADYVPATDVGAWTEALVRAVTDDDRRRRASGPGVARADGFSWKATGAATISAYRSRLGRA